MDPMPENNRQPEQSSDILNVSDLPQGISDYERSFLITLQNEQLDGPKLLGLTLKILESDVSSVEKGEAIRAIQTYNEDRIKSAVDSGQEIPAGMGSVRQLCPRLINACGFIARLDSIEERTAMNDLKNQLVDLYRAKFNFNP